jgi:hypothetical protein
LELEDAIDYSKFFSFAPPDLLKSFPPAKVIDAMRVRLDADKAADTHLVVGFQFPDPQDACALEIRRGVAVFHDQLPEHTDAMITTTSGVIHQLLGGQTTPADALQAGDITPPATPPPPTTSSPTSSHPPRTPSNSSSAERRTNPHLSGCIVGRCGFYLLVLVALVVVAVAAILSGPGPLLESAHDHLPGCPCSRRVPAS